MKPRVLALCGGVGGAKLALGLQHELAAGELAVVVNVGDDFEHLGLRICPDLDTVFYTLAGIANAEQGWGRAEETWNVLTALGEFGGPDWFRLGDKDIALHLRRTERLRGGARLTEVALELARRQGLPTLLLPASDDAVRTVVQTNEGVLPFQDYFVRRRCEPAVLGLAYEGAATARIPDELAACLAAPSLEAVVICPSNPWLSIDPMLAMPAIRSFLQQRRVPVVAVTPIVAGQAIKGPAARIMSDLGLTPCAGTVATHYAGLIDGFVLDRRDADLAAGIGVRTCVTDTVMRSLADRRELARATLRFAAGG